MPTAWPEPGGWWCRPSTKRSPCSGEHSHCSLSCPRHPIVMARTRHPDRPRLTPGCPRGLRPPRSAPTLRAGSSLAAAPTEPWTPILRGLGLARLQWLPLDERSEPARRLVDHESHDPIAKTEGRYLLGVSAFWRGDLASARQYLEGAIEAYDLSHRHEHLALYAQDPKAVCLVRPAWVDLWAEIAGRADEGPDPHLRAGCRSRSSHDLVGTSSPTRRSSRPNPRISSASPNCSRMRSVWGSAYRCATS